MSVVIGVSIIECLDCVLESQDQSKAIRLEIVFTEQSPDLSILEHSIYRKNITFCPNTRPEGRIIVH